MAGFKILKFPLETLKKRAANVPAVGDEERKILSEMAKTMYLNGGVGLAAVQVGIDRQMAVVDTGKGLIKMVNPVVVGSEGAETYEEGCLSVPGASVKVRRASRITVQYLNEFGEITQLNAEGLLARAIQHEIDHLSGKLIIDYLSPLKRMFMPKGPSKGKSHKKS